MRWLSKRGEPVGWDGMIRKEKNSGGESAGPQRLGLVRRYRRLAVGEFASVADWLFYEFYLVFLAGIKGGLGLLLRYLVKNILFAKAGKGTAIGSSVTLRCPGQIVLSDGVIVEDYAQLIADSGMKESIVIGKSSFVRSNAILNAGPPTGFIHIGENTGIGQSTIIYGNGGVRIGNNVLIAGQCFLVSTSHNFGNLDSPISEQGFESREIIIADNVWIGAGAKILYGVSIGEGAIIGANSVVKFDVGANEIVAGIPARMIGHREKPNSTVV